ncbi:MAG: hypothetical protein KAX49_06745 [Halanaerobiales bacterium]|nr:hypothetical protein [Halanaerobiales bacterium]
MYLKSKKDKSQFDVKPVGICMMATCEAGCYSSCAFNCTSCTGTCTYNCAATCATGPGPQVL